MSQTIIHCVYGSTFQAHFRPQLEQRSDWKLSYPLKVSPSLLTHLPSPCARTKLSPPSHAHLVYGRDHATRTLHRTVLLWSAGLPELSKRESQKSSQ